MRRCNGVDVVLNCDYVNSLLYIVNMSPEE